MTAPAVEIVFACDRSEETPRLLGWQLMIGGKEAGRLPISGGDREFMRLLMVALALGGSEVVVRAESPT